MGSIAFPFQSRTEVGLGKLEFLVDLAAASEHFETAKILGLGSHYTGNYTADFPEVQSLIVVDTASDLVIVRGIAEKALGEVGLDAESLDTAMRTACSTAEGCSQREGVVGKDMVEQTHLEVALVTHALEGVASSEILM